jgi:hypothetical protein
MARAALVAVTRPDPEPDLNAFGDEAAVGLVHRVAVDAPGRGRSAPVDRDLPGARPVEVVVEVRGAENVGRRAMAAAPLGLDVAGGYAMI